MTDSILESAKEVEFLLLNVAAQGNKGVTGRLDQRDLDGRDFHCKLADCGTFDLNEAGRI